MKFFLVIWALIGIVSSVYAENKNDVKVVSYKSGIVKGKALDYFGDDISKNYKIITVKAFSFNDWAGKLYLMKDGKKITDEIDAMIVKQSDNAENFAIGYCTGYLRAWGFKEGISLVDNFDVQYIENENVVRLFYSGNAICMVKK